MNNKGFSLIELVIVIAIIGILAVIGITQFSGITDKANIAVDESNAAEVANAAKMYLALNPKADSIDQISLETLAEEELIDGSMLDEGEIKAKSENYGASDNKVMSISSVNGQVRVSFGEIEAYPNQFRPEEEPVNP